MITKLLFSLLVAPALLFGVGLPAGLLAGALSAAAYGRNLFRLEWAHLPQALVLALLIDAGRVSGWLRGLSSGKGVR